MSLLFLLGPSIHTYISYTGNETGLWADYCIYDPIYLLKDVNSYSQEISFF